MMRNIFTGKQTGSHESCLPIGGNGENPANVSSPLTIFSSKNLQENFWHMLWVHVLIRSYSGAGTL